MDKNDISARLRNSGNAFTQTAECIAEQIGQVAKLVLKAITLGGKPIFFGNGGSAADAQHLAAEFVGRFVKERCSLPALALNTDVAAITAIGNDFGYDVIFDRQITALGNPCDVAIGLTSQADGGYKVRTL